MREQAVAAGLAEPASLHPVIDTLRCIGCGSCVKACPEQPEHHVLGLIGNKAQLISPSDCIGHGACRSACPVDAITLVFGSAKRGVDIPMLSPDFETSVPGIYIAGELGGMGLIRNALSQGRQAVDAIRRQRPRADGRLDLVIVGAGPAGFAASLTAMSHRMNFVTVEQESLGGCVFQYPRAKMVMTSPVTLPMVGKVRFGHTAKEALLDFWREVERKTGLADPLPRARRGRHPRRRRLRGANDPRRVPDDQRAARDRPPRHAAEARRARARNCRRSSIASSTRSSMRARTCSWSVAATARSRPRRASPRAASRSVTLSYRGDSFSRAKPKNRERIAAAEQAGRLRVLFSSEVRRIEPDRVVLASDGRDVDLSNDAVIVSAGGVLPAEFLRGIGIEVETKYGTA